MPDDTQESRAAEVLGHCGGGIDPDEFKLPQDEEFSTDVGGQELEEDFKRYRAEKDAGLR